MSWEARLNIPRLLLFVNDKAQLAYSNLNFLLMYNMYYPILDTLEQFVSTKHPQKLTLA